MKIAILGAGNVGCALAADYAYRGNELTLIKTSHAAHDDNFEYLLTHGGDMTMSEFGDIRHSNIAHLSRDVSDIAGAELVIVCVQTIYHKALIRSIAPYLGDGQLLMFIPGYFSTAYVLELCPHKNITVIEAESAFVDGRINTPGVFTAGFRNVRNPLGVYPLSSLERVKKTLDTLGTPFTYLKSVAEAALHNPNMIVHTVGAVMSIPRIENTGGDYCMYHEAFTPSVWNILTGLDGEKMAVLQHLGFEPVPYVDACKFRNSLDESEDAKKVFFDYAAMPSRAKGPTSVDSRYITEDVSQGLVMLESIARVLGINTPVATALIELAGAALCRDLRSSGRSVEELGRVNIEAILQHHLN